MDDTDKALYKAIDAMPEIPSRIKDQMDKDQEDKRFMKAYGGNFRLEALNTQECSVPPIIGLTLEHLNNFYTVDFKQLEQRIKDHMTKEQIAKPVPLIPCILEEDIKGFNIVGYQKIKPIDYYLKREGIIRSASADMYGLYGLVLEKIKVFKKLGEVGYEKFKYNNYTWQRVLVHGLEYNWSKYTPCALLNDMNRDVTFFENNITVEVIE